MTERATDGVGWRRVFEVLLTAVEAEAGLRDRVGAELVGLLGASAPGWSSPPVWDDDEDGEGNESGSLDPYQGGATWRR